MGIGVGLFLVAVGAILTFTISGHPLSGVSLGAIGVILMIVGALGVILDLVLFMPRRRSRETYVEPPATTQRYPDRY